MQLKHGLIKQGQSKLNSSYKSIIYIIQEKLLLTKNSFFFFLRWIATCFCAFLFDSFVRRCHESFWTAFDPMWGRSRHSAAIFFLMLFGVSVYQLARLEVKIIAFGGMYSKNKIWARLHNGPTINVHNIKVKIEEESQHFLCYYTFFLPKQLSNIDFVNYMM